MGVHKRIRRMRRPDKFYWWFKTPAILMGVDNHLKAEPSYICDEIGNSTTTATDGPSVTTTKSKTQKEL